MLTHNKKIATCDLWACLWAVGLGLGGRDRVSSASTRALEPSTPLAWACPLAWAGRPPRTAHSESLRHQTGVCVCLILNAHNHYQPESLSRVGPWTRWCGGQHSVARRGAYLCSLVSVFSGLVAPPPQWCPWWGRGRGAAPGAPELQLPLGTSVGGAATHGKRAKLCFARNVTI